ncbi:hypothetical protein GCM10014719_24230 [Planomonospora parontospora subsp. antibiotica]|nr:hypothetical protein GCM10014719_24230 [Planomonospora parontospora subsp. antibiotica]GII15799.1 hypothetical protein Ppa05_25250 [Planomonospora parontospora subsp. antibiotica]
MNGVEFLEQAVTPPLPEGSGFSLSRLRSLTKGKPCPHDVDRRVRLYGVRGMPAPASERPETREAPPVETTA